MAVRARLEETINLVKADKAFLGVVKTASLPAYWQYNCHAGLEADVESFLAAVEAEVDAR